jgi:hypothetical protein
MNEIVELDDIEHFDKPPTPPLGVKFVNTLKSSSSRTHNKDGTLNIEDENWTDGTDSKWKAFQNIRRHKKKFWYE